MIGKWCGVLLGLVAGGGVFAEGTLSLSTGVDYSSGKYGDAAHTEIATLPFAIKYETAPWTFKASIPYVRMDGPGNVVSSGGDTVVLQGSGIGHRRSEGWGDLVLGAAWTAYEGDGWLIDLAGKAKLATGDAARGLSTGKNDYSLQVDGFRKVGPGTVFASLGRRKMGDPEGVDLKDPWYGSVGWSTRFSQAWSGGLSVDYREKLQVTGAPLRETTAFVSRRFGEAWKMQVYAVTGHSRASPDLGGGLLLIHSH